MRRLQSLSLNLGLFRGKPGSSRSNRPEDPNWALTDGLESFMKESYEIRLFWGSLQHQTQ